MWAAFGSLVAGNFVARILLALGVSFVSYQGLDAILSLATAEVHGLLSGLPSMALGLLGLARIDLCINLVLSGYAARLAMMAVTALRVR
ncbi:DUF2523 family protein [Aeromonas caviae]|uniref:DUF2523 family protein n=1 Tax=Aeromonas caviae TaxID=648 RepID=UPI002B49B66C|nr:DUF2523 family protein [Aeromonas caviae]